MKLIYTIPNKLWWIHDVLDKDTYKIIHNSIIKERNDINLQSAMDVWDSNLHDNLEPPQRVDVSKYPPIEKLKLSLLSNSHFQYDDISSIHTSIHFMKKGSGINWHSDHKWKYGATYYLNNKWNIHWGGEFMFADTEAYGFLPIVGNSMVIVKSPLDHKVNPILSPIVPRISVQMFMK